MRRGFLFLFLFYVLPLHCLEIAFFIKHNAAGEIEVLEPNSLFSHVAMKVGDQWLNAHPWRGVYLTNDMRDMGEIYEILSNPEIPEPDDIFLDKVLYKKFFIFADWNDPEYFNCTKLVAKYLNLEPQPMVIDPVIWGNRFQEYNGRRGLSPGELYKELQSSSFQVKVQPRGACAHKLRHNLT